jgi:hypothetical protein
MTVAPPTPTQGDTDRRASRLAELVSGLTGCQTGGALSAVREHQFDGDALGVVARAMVDVDGPPVEGFRVAGFLREETVVQHQSLRRRDRLHPEADARKDVVTDNCFAARVSSARARLRRTDA